jgi:hypothetical protein
MLNTKAILPLLTFVLCLYIVSIGFIDFFNLPYFAKKIQLPEMITIIGIFPLVCLYIIKHKNYFTNYWQSINIIDIFILFYIISLAVADLMGKHHHAIPTLMGYFYLMFIFFCFKFIYFSAKNNNQDFFLKLEQAVIWLGVIQSCIGLVGWLFWYFADIESSFIQLRVSYMYFNKVARIQGLAGDPNMLASILSTSIIFIYNKILIEKYNNRYNIIFLIICGVGLLFTMSKAALLLFAMLILVYKYQLAANYNLSYLKAKILGLSTFIIVVLFLLITHFYITSIETNPLMVNKGGSFISEKPLITYSNHALYETSYSVNKKASFFLFKRFPMWGVGLGKQELWCDSLRLENKYPNSFSNLDAHCSYSAAFSETGILGGVAYISFIMSILYSVFFLIKKFLFAQNTLFIGICGVIIMAAIEALTLENSTFRHHWVCFGILSGLISHYKIEKNNNKLAN